MPDKEIIRIDVPTMENPITFESDGMQNLTISDVIDNVAKEFELNQDIMTAKAIHSLVKRNALSNNREYPLSTKIHELPFSKEADKTIRTITFPEDHVGAIF